MLPETSERLPCSSGERLRRGSAIELESQQRGILEDLQLLVVRVVPARQIPETCSLFLLLAETAVCIEALLRRR